MARAKVEFMILKRDDQSGSYVILDKPHVDISTAGKCRKYIRKELPKGVYRIARVGEELELVDLAPTKTRRALVAAE